MSNQSVFRQPSRAGERKVNSVRKKKKRCLNSYKPLCRGKRESRQAEQNPKQRLFEKVKIKEGHKARSLSVGGSPNVLRDSYSGFLVFLHSVELLSFLCSRDAGRDVFIRLYSVCNMLRKKNESTTQIIAPCLPNYLLVCTSVRLFRSQFLAHSFSRIIHPSPSFFFFSHTFPRLSPACSLLSASRSIKLQSKWHTRTRQEKNNKKTASPYFHFTANQGFLPSPSSYQW